jgi:hypothetical protein
MDLTTDPSLVALLDGCTSLLAYREQLLEQLLSCIYVKHVHR